MKFHRLSLSITFILMATYGLLVFLSRTQLLVDNKAFSHYSLRKGTVRELLDHFDVALSTNDVVRPDLNQKIRWGETVRVIRVLEEFEEKEEVVDFILDWKRRTSKNLRLVELQHGHREKTKVIVKRILHDGQEYEVVKTTKSVQKIPVERLVFINSRGHPEKVYDLSKAKKMALIATAYWKGDPQVPSETTFSGHKVQRGLVAVDPNVIPLGYRLYIPGYGYAYSSDTGSMIKGKRIDLFVESKKASRKWEYNKVTVYLLEKARRW